MHPRQMRETFVPLFPSVAYSIAGPRGPSSSDSSKNKIHPNASEFVSNRVIALGIPREGCFIIIPIRHVRGGTGRREGVARMVEKLDRAPVHEAKVGSRHNAEEIEEIILSNRWPQAQCKACGKMHVAAIRKVLDTPQGGEFEFVEPECPNPEAVAEEGN